MIRELRGQVKSRQTDAATGIEDQWFAARGLPAGNAMRKGAAVIVGNGFLERVPDMTLYLRLELRMRIGLTAGDEVGIRVHRAVALRERRNYACIGHYGQCRH